KGESVTHVSGMKCYLCVRKHISRSVPIFKAMLSAFDICRPHVASPMLALTAEDQAAVKVDVIERFGQFVT
ncbi:MAG: hypothetical protein ACE1ZA_09625, partial [Pseudomonadales bacterium]